MGKGKKGAKSGLGAALVKSQRRTKASARQARREGDEDVIAALGFESVGTTTKSVTETGQLEAFLADAALAGRTFEAQRNVRVIELNEGTEETLEEEEQEPLPSFDFRSLPIPRRPEWTREMTAQELDRKEKDNFLAWRRGIATLEANNPALHVTPFEKNLDYWRQLWRVVERSDVIVQVVDARNPLLFRCEDVEAFARETGAHKQCVLLVNKADFLSEELRSAWRAYFEQHGLQFIFFSAKAEQARLDAGDKGDKDVKDEGPAGPLHGSDRLLSRAELRRALEQLAADSKARRPAGGSEEAAATKGTVGMIGYPNVGKSSVINVLFGVTSTDHSTARVSVAATPGHTKHFQTLHLSDETMLCDCPGLVFPTFMSTKADLLCNGILPIDEIRGRDFFPAIQVLCRCISRETLERTYAMQLPLAPGIRHAPAGMAIEAFCEKRGLHGSGHGRFNEALGARVLLKDFVSGKLCYCCPPPLEAAASGSLLGAALGGRGAAAAEEGEGPMLEVAGAASTNEPEISEEDLALLLDEQQLLYTETQKMDKGLKEALAKPTGKRTKKKAGGKGRKGRQADPYGEGDYFEARVAGKRDPRAKKGQKAVSFTRVVRPWDTQEE